MTAPAHVDIIAHRGASAYAPENTLAAFTLAAAMGADWFELDCSFSRDDAIIVLHDDKVDRTTNGKGLVASLSLAELKALDAGAKHGPRFEGERLPTLDEALALAKERRIGVYIEIKNADNDAALIKQMDECAPEGWHALVETSASHNVRLARAVAECVRSRHMQRQVVIQSFAPVVCAYLVRNAKDLRTELLVGWNGKDKDGWDQSLRFAANLGVQGVNPNMEAATPDFVRTCHDRGQTMAVWTIDSPADMKRLAESGVDRLITNRPDICLATLEEMKLRRPAS